MMLMCIFAHAFFKLFFLIEVVIGEVILLSYGENKINEMGKHLLEFNYIYNKLS